MLTKVRIFIERYYTLFSSLAGFVKKIIRSGFAGFRIKDIYLVSRGFYFKRPIPYNFKEYSYSDYISDFEQNLIGFINHPYNKILNDKVLFSIFFKSYFKTPVSYCLLTKGSVSNVNPSIKITSMKDIHTLLYDKQKLILKPNDGRGGDGIYLISVENKNIYVNGRINSEIEFEKFLTNLNGSILTDFVEQGNFTREIFANSTNTLRIITMIDPLNCSAFIPIAILRIGTSVSQPIDNFPKGGIFAYIDVNSGKLSKAISSRDGKIVFLENHPETGVQIEGKFIPGWNKIVENLLNTSNLVAPFLKIVGWDIVITENGDFTVIEGNSGPDMTIQGLNYPLAKDTRVLNFLKQNKVR